MKVTVVLAGVFRESLGVGELVEELPDGSTVMDLISALASKYDGYFDQVATREGEVNRDYAVIVNGSFIYKLNHKLNDGDRVLLSDVIEVSLSGG